MVSVRCLEILLMSQSLICQIHVFLCGPDWLENNKNEPRVINMTKCMTKVMFGDPIVHKSDKLYGLLILI